MSEVQKILDRMHDEIVVASPLGGGFIYFPPEEEWKRARFADNFDAIDWKK